MRRSRAGARTLTNAPLLSGCITAVVVVLGWGDAVLALPQGMMVQGGQLELQQHDANNALIRQGSDRAAADFNSFNIDAGQRLQILQPNASSTFLGRVINSQITEIHGRLDANGRVLLINPAGVLVGPGGVVNTAGFTATTLHVDHQRFMQGGVVELQTLPGADPQASVINRGTITVNDGGFAALIAPHVVNDGLITARLGQIQLASGTAATLDISGDGLLSVALDPAIAGTITNNGTLQASHVRLGGGDAAVLAAATVQHSGLIEARSIDELLGGQITIEGEHITVTSGAVLDATGANGGGTILVGGSWQNSDPTVRQATTTTIEAEALLDASATDRGNGGTVVAWSDIKNPLSRTEVYGSLYAKGGAEGGNGGRIETSGYVLDVAGIDIAANAYKGKAGLWLLDPQDLQVVSSGGASASVDAANAVASGTDTTINASIIEASLNAGTSVALTASRDIAVNAAISKTTNGNGSLAFTAGRDILLNASITISGSSGNLELVAGRSITQASGSASTVGGNISFTARNISIVANLTSTSGDINLVGDSGSTVVGSFNGVQISGNGVEVKTLATNLVAGATGAITVRGRGGGTESDLRASGVYLFAGGSISAGGSGNVSVTGIGGMSTQDDESTGVLISNSLAANGVSQIITAGGDITVTGTAGGASGAKDNYGVQVRSYGRIAAGGSGSVSVTGTATENGGTGNSGVIVINTFNSGSQAAPTAAITSAGGGITLTGTGTANGAAVVLRNAGKVTSGGSSNVTVVADSIQFDTEDWRASSPATTGSITSGSGGTATATIRPRTAGTLINLGGADVLSGSPLTLGLSTAELARITAATLVVGSSTAGGISVSQALTTTPGMNLSLISGAGLNVAAALSTTSGGSFSTMLGANLVQTAPLQIAGLSTFNTGSADALLGNSNNTFAGAFAFTGRSLLLTSSSPLTFAGSTLLGDLNVTTTNGSISQSGPLVVQGRTTLATGTGDITLLNRGNRFSIVPLTISSSGSVKIYPCSATDSCNNKPTIPDTAEIRQVILTSAPGLVQNNQMNTIQNTTEPFGNPTISSSSGQATQAEPETNDRSRVSLGQGSLEFNAEEASCADPEGCGGS